MFENFNISTLLLTLYFTVTTITVIILHELFGDEIKQPWTTIILCFMWPIVLVVLIIRAVYCAVKWFLNFFSKK